MPTSTVDYETIKRNISIGLVLRKYGYRAPDRHQYRMACMLHGGSNSTAFSVDEKRGLWNCFNCNVGGSVIDLVAAIEKIDIKEAARRLSTDFNLSPAHTSVAAARVMTSKVARWKELQKYPSDIQLPDTIELEEGYRGLTRKTIDHWGLKRVPVPPTTELHTVPNGVLIPLHNAHGGICSYSVRKDEGEPKYWNSPGSARCGMMGLYNNKEDIIKAGFTYICEGQFDCISLWQKGFRNVVALRGSSLTEPQAMLLLQLTSKLILLLDGDGPGIEAAKKIKAHWQKIFDISIVTLPDQKDPDELTVQELNRLLYDQKS